MNVPLTQSTLSAVWSVVLVDPHGKVHGMSAAGFKVHFTPTEQGMALEDFNGKEIWDAAWGETDYDYSDEQEEEEESAPWGLTNKRIEGFPQLPGEEELKEREEVRRDLWSHACCSQCPAMWSRGPGLSC